MRDKELFISLMIFCIILSVMIVGFTTEPKEPIQTVQIIQGNDTTLCTGVIDDTQYYVKVFDSLNNIKVQVRGNFKINYLK